MPFSADPDNPVILEDVTYHHDDDDDDEMDEQNVYPYFIVEDLYQPTEPFNFDSTCVLPAYDVAEYFVIRFSSDPEDPQGGYDADTHIYNLSGALSQMRHDTAYWLRLRLAQLKKTNANTCLDFGLDEFIQPLSPHLNMVMAMELAYFTGSHKVPEPFMKWWVTATHIKPENLWDSYLSIWEDELMPPHIRSWMHSFGTHLKFFITLPNRKSDILPESDQETIAEVVPIL